MMNRTDAIEGEDMSEWIEVTTTKLIADNILRIGDGYRAKNSELSTEGFPFARAGNINNGFQFSGADCLPLDYLEVVGDKISRSGDTVFTSKGTVGRFGFVNSKTPQFVYSPQLCYWRSLNHEKLAPRFVYYWMHGKESLEQIDSLKGQTDMADYVSLADQRKMIITIPPLAEQKAIASVLSSLDDKIDLLHRQNKTLEAIGETLFRQWFIEEAQANWESGELRNYVNCFNGVSYKSDDLNPSKKAMVTLKSFDRDGGFKLNGFKEFTGKYKEQHIVNQGDLVVAHTDITQDAAVIGNPVLVVSDPAYEELVISMDLVKVVPKHDWLSREYLYMMMKTREFKQHCLGYSNGSTVLHLSKEAIPLYEFFIPPTDKIAEFSQYAKNLFEKKFENIIQIRTLEKLRDTLLPKLMSGEVRVDYNH
jgi:type I restriction enzyme S subunit